MNPTQILLTVLAALVLVVVLRRFLTARGLRHYTPEEAAQRMKTGEAVLLDVRSGRERQDGAIRNSIHIPLHLLRKRTEELAAHREKEIICYCAVGSRSLAAAAMLQRQGFRTASMRGGIAGWNSSGLRS